MIIKSTKNIIIASGIAVVAVVVVLASGWWNPSWNPFTGQSSAGNDIVVNSLSKAMAAKSFELSGQLAIDMQTTSAMLGGEENGAKEIKFNLSAQEQIDKANSKNIKAKALINLAMQTEGATISADLEGVNVGDNVYLKLTSFPSFLPLPIDLTKIKDQWMKLSVKDLQNKLAAAGLPAASGDENNLQTTLKNLQEIAKGKKFFNIQRRFSQENIGGAAADHYAVELNKKTVREFLPAYLELAKKYAPLDQQAEVDKQINEVKADLDTNFEKYWQSLGGFSFEIWVDKASGRLVKVKWDREIDPSQFSQNQPDIKQMKLRLEITLTKFNENFEITEPSDFKTAEELLGALMPASSATSTTSTKP